MWDQKNGHMEGLGLPPTVSSVPAWATLVQLMQQGDQEKVENCLFPLEVS